VAGTVSPGRSLRVQLALARGGRCHLAGRSLRASCPSLARCWPRFRHPGFAWPATPARLAPATPREPVF